MPAHRHGTRGVSLPELLVVIAILALGTMVAVPMIGDRIRETRSRTSVGQYVVALRAARMVAVATGEPVDVNVKPAPLNSFDYVDSGGRRQEFKLPEGMRIVSSTDPITFRPNGASHSAGVTVIEATRIEGPQDRVEVRVPSSGIPRVVELGPGSSAPPS